MVQQGAKSALWNQEAKEHYLNEEHSTLSVSISTGNEHYVPFAWCEIEYKTTDLSITHSELNKL